MPFHNPPAYDDLTFSLLLNEVGCPMPLHEIKLFILGCLAADEMPGMDTVFETLWGGKEPIFDSADQAERFAETMFALWNHLAARMSSRPFLFSASPRMTAAQDVNRFARRRRAEADAFLRGLNAGRTDISRLHPLARTGLGLLEKAMHMWSEVERVSQIDVNADAESIAKTVDYLRQLDQMAHDVIWSIARAQHLARVRFEDDGHGGDLKPL